MADLDPIIQPIEADISDLTAKLKAAEQAGDKLRKAEIDRTRKAEKEKNKIRRDALATRIREARKVQGGITSAQKAELAQFRKIEQAKTKIAVDAAKKRSKEAQKIATQRATKETGGGGLAVAGAGAGIAAGAVGLKKIGDAFGAAIAKSREFETAFTGLRAVARAAGDSVGASLEQVTDAAKNLAADGTLSVKDTSQSLKLLLSQGKSLDRAFELTEAVKQISAVENISGDAGQATQDLFKGLITSSADLVENASPSFRSLAKEFGGLTAVTQDATAQQKFFDAVIAKAQGQVEGYGESLKTGAATQRAFNQEMDRFLGDIGSSLEPAISSVTSALTGMVMAVRDAFGGLSDTSKAVVVFGAGLAAAVPAIGAIISGIGVLTAAMTKMGIAATFALGPIGLIIASVAALTVATVFLVEATSGVSEESEKAAKAYVDAGEAASKAAKGTKEAADATKNFEKAQSKLTPGVKAFIKQNKLLIIDLEQRKRVIGELIDLEKKLGKESEKQLIFRLTQLGATQHELEQRIKRNQAKVDAGGSNAFDKAAIKGDQLRLDAVNRQRAVIDGMIDSMRGVGKESKKVTTAVKGTGAALKKSSTQIKEATRLLNKYFIAARDVNDEYRQQNENLKTSLGLTRKLNETAGQFELRSKVDFESINEALAKVDKELKVKGANFKVVAGGDGKVRSQADLNKQAIFELERLKELDKDRFDLLVKQNPKLRAVLDRLKEQRKELERQREIYELIEGQLNKVQSGIDGLNEGLEGANQISENLGKSTGGVIQGLAGATKGASNLGEATGLVSESTNALVQSFGGIAAGIGVAISLLDQLFDKETRAEELARRRQEINENLAEIEERRIAQIEIQNNLLGAQLTIEQQRQNIALETLSARKEIDALFGQADLKDTKKQLRRAEGKLENIQKKSKVQQFDLSTKEGQVASLDKRNKIQKERNALNQALSIISGTDDFNELDTENIQATIKSLMGLKDKAGSRGGVLSGSIDGLKEIIKTRRERAEAKARISELAKEEKRQREKARSSKGKGGATTEASRAAADKAAALRSKIEFQQDKVLGLKAKAGGLSSDVTTSGAQLAEGAVKRADSIIKTIDRARELGQDVFELGEQATEQQQEKALNRLQDIIDDNDRRLQTKLGKTDDPDKESALELSFAQEAVASLRKAIGFDGTIGELVKRINKAQPGFEKDRDIMLLNQMQALQGIQESSATTAMNTASLAEFGTDRQAGLLDISRGLLTNALGGFSIPTAAQGLQLTAPQSVTGIASTLGSLGGQSIEEKQLTSLQSIQADMNRLVEMAESSGNFTVDQLQQQLLSILSNAEGAAIG